MQNNNYYERVWEYLLVISPSEDVKKSIGNIKKEVGVKYGGLRDINSSSYIPLIKFALIKGYERNLLSLLFGFCVNSIPFNIELDRFCVFPYHTLYAGILENLRLNHLQNSIAVMLKNSCSVRDKNIRVSKKLHMTIAHNLSPAQFNPIAREYSKRKINSAFIAKNIVMLRRPVEDYSDRTFRWRESHNFTLGYN